ncbi:unnamed protein product [Camellia sinensis]
MQRKAQEANVSSEEEEEMMRELERKETELMRLQRHKMGIDDFEQLIAIGKGAFAEVWLRRAKSTGEIFAMKKLKKSDMLSRGQHMDIKPDNLILDKNGHLKLSDFGLCKPLDNKYLTILLEDEDFSTQDTMKGILARNRHALAYSTVGTLDYMAPEVLRKKGYGMECDWWSLGAIMYEMLKGYPPFCLEDQRMTCKKIINWKACLKFPEEPKISDEAKDLICHLLCDVETRLGTNGVEEIKVSTSIGSMVKIWPNNLEVIGSSLGTTTLHIMPKAHPWFKCIQWDMLYEMEAAYKPTVSGDLDTQNFEKFPEVGDPPSILPRVGPWRKMLTSKDSNFIGYTFKKSDIPQSVKTSGTDMRSNGSSKVPSLTTLFGQIRLEENVLMEGDEKEGT